MLRYPAGRNVNRELWGWRQAPLEAQMADRRHPAPDDAAPGGPADDMAADQWAAVDRYIADELLSPDPVLDEVLAENPAGDEADYYAGEPRD